MIPFTPRHPPRSGRSAPSSVKRPSGRVTAAIGRAAASIARFSKQAASLPNPSTNCDPYVWIPRFAILPCPSTVVSSTPSGLPAPLRR